MLKYILSILGIGLAWTAVKVLHLPEWVGIALTGVQALVSVIIFLVRFFRSRNSAKKLEKALAAQGDEHAKLARPEQQAEVVALKGEFLKAVGALKASRLGKGGMSALYALPWYMIIGPPGAGKSTALRNSGLQFPYLSASGGAVRGIGGTRNCDWWLTNEAILLDTAGRYTSDDEDKDEWLSFLDLLRTNRPKKPVNGIFVAVSIAEIAKANDDELAALSLRLRERIDEVVERLQIVAPVYLLLTKVDLIEGFTDIFGDLKKADRAQIWGFTLPLEADPRPINDVLGQRFDELLEGVKKRATRRLGQERRIETREKIFGFPQQFALLRPQLGTFLTTLFAANVFKETPMIRGVYFTSGTQEGRPIDRVMTAMAEAFGVAPQLPAAEPVVEQKSYFLGDVFGRVVFPDKNLASRTRLAAARLRNRAYAMGAAAFGLALLVSAFPAYAYVKNRQLIGSTADIVAEVAARRAKASSGPLGLDKLEPLRQRVDLLRQYKEDSPPAELRFGLYRGNDLYPHVSALYADVLRTDVVKPIVARTAESLEGFAKDPQESSYDPGLYDNLKLYLVLTGPRDAGEPVPSGALLDWTAARVVAAWAEALGGELTEEQLAAMTSHAKLYLQLAAADATLPLPRDLDMVKKVRIGLAGIPLEKVVLDPLIADMSKEGYDLDLTRLLGGKASTIMSKGIVRGAFTRKAWEQKVRTRLGQASSGAEPWVLGAEGARMGKPGEQMKALRARYFELYTQEWRSFLESLRMKHAATPLEVLAILQDLTRGVPAPLGRVFREVAFNVHLEEESSGKGGGMLDKAAGAAIDKAGSKLGPGGKLAAGAAKDALAGDGAVSDAAAVEQAFAGFTSFGVPPAPPPSQEGQAAPPAQVQLDVYQEQLQFLRDALTAYIENPGEPAPMLTRLAGARTGVDGMIEEQDIGWRPRFRALLWPVIEDATYATKKNVTVGKGLPWCNEVVVSFDRALKGKYPFNANGHDVALADLADFYKPDGVLWTFFDATLADSIQRNGDVYSFSSSLGGSSGYSSSILGFLSRAREITTVLFPAGVKEPTVEFEIRIRPSPSVATITFDLDGQSVKTQNEPDRWYKLKWPGDGKTKGAAIKVKGAQNLSETLRQDGDWGLFRLLEQGKVEANMSSRVFSVTWTLSSRAGVQIVIDIKPSRNESPFFGTSRKAAKLLAPFRRSDVNPPHSLTPSGGGCATGVN